MMQNNVKEIFKTELQKFMPEENEAGETRPITNPQRLVPPRHPDQRPVAFLLYSSDDLPGIRAAKLRPNSPF